LRGISRRRRRKNPSSPNRLWLPHTHTHTERERVCQDAGVLPVQIWKRCLGVVGRLLLHTQRRATGKFSLLPRRRRCRRRISLNLPPSPVLASLVASM
jgi:hypothetical protein